jgi:hypothetical protein
MTGARDTLVDRTVVRTDRERCFYPPWSELAPRAALSTRPPAAVLLPPVADGSGAATANRPQR